MHTTGYNNATMLPCYHHYCSTSMLSVWQQEGDWFRKKFCYNNRQKNLGIQPSLQKLWPVQHSRKQY